MDIPTTLGQPRATPISVRRFNEDRTRDNIPELSRSVPEQETSIEVSRNHRRRGIKVFCTFGPLSGRTIYLVGGDSEYDFPHDGATAVRGPQKPGSAVTSDMNPARHPEDLRAIWLIVPDESETTFNGRSDPGSSKDVSFRVRHQPNGDKTSVGGRACAPLSCECSSCNGSPAGHSVSSGSSIVAAAADF